MTKTLRNINQEWNTMVSSRNELQSGGKQARLLFVVREGKYDDQNVREHACKGFI